MATTFKSPGVYVQEIQKLPASVAQVETAIPAFIGYTEKTPKKISDPSEDDPVLRVESLLDYETHFGGPPAEDIEIKVDANYVITGAKVKSPSAYKMYHALRMFYANGGGACYIISVGNYATRGKEVDTDELKVGLGLLEIEDEPTLIVFPDAASLQNEAYHLYQDALTQCNKLQDRFVIMDTYDDTEQAIEGLRNDVGQNYLKYGAAYYPWLRTNFGHHYTPETITFDDNNSPKLLKGSLKELLNSGEDNPGPTEEDGDPDQGGTTSPAVADVLTSAFLESMEREIDKLYLTLPPSSAMAGVYATVDRERGVWKAPANVSLNAVTGPTVKVTNNFQDRMNVDVQAGKSVNAIRSFFGRGTLVWGARTLAGNDNEWRYINVRRFFNMVEESVKKSIHWAVFEPNGPNTWVRVTAMIENYLTGLWRQGALVGATTEQAFFVHVGLGTTMTSQDVLEGKMNVEIGLATSRPAEFIILKFSHKLQEA